MAFKKNNIKKPACILLVIYSFILILASLHCHELNFYNNSNLKFEKTKTTSTELDASLDDDSVCQLCLFSNTKLIIDYYTNLDLSLSQISENIPIDYSGYYPTYRFFDFNLRAPPSYS